MRAKFSMYLLPDEYMSRYLRAWGCFEPKIEKFILSNVRPDTVFVDVGANLGYFSLRVTTEYPDVQTLAFEPNSSLASLFRKSAALNGAEERIQIEEMGLSDEDGSCSLLVDPLHSGLSRITQETTTDPSSSQIRMDTWDEWIQKNPISLPVSVVKVDVEGAEMKVLRGMRDWLTKHRPMLVVEANDNNLSKYGSSQGELALFVKDLGYKNVYSPDYNLYLAPI